MSYPDFKTIFEDENVAIGLSILEDISILLKPSRKMLLIAGTPDVGNKGHQWYIIGFNGDKNSVIAKGKSLEPFIKSLREFSDKFSEVDKYFDVDATDMLTELAVLDVTSCTKQFVARELRHYEIVTSMENCGVDGERECIWYLIDKCIVAKQFPLTDGWETVIYNTPFTEEQSMAHLAIAYHIN